MKKTLNQGGNTYLIVILVVLAILLSGVSFYFYNQYRSGAQENYKLKTQLAEKEDNKVLKNTSTLGTPNNTESNASLDQIIDEIKGYMEVNDLLKVFEMQNSVIATCGSAYVNVDLCKGKNNGDEVSGYEVSNYPGEGSISSYEVVQNAWKRYMDYGPYKFYSYEIRTIDSISEDINNYAKVSFIDNSGENALVLVFTKKDNEWSLTNSYYRVPIE